MIPIYRDYRIERTDGIVPADSRWYATQDDGEPCLFGATPEDCREAIDDHIEWMEDRFLRRRLAAAPVLSGMRRADGTMALYRGYRQVGLLLSEAVIQEALACGWYVSDSWQDRLYRVIPTEDAHKALLSALAASAGVS
jgi:hypothetical protein